MFLTVSEQRQADLSLKQRLQHRPDRTSSLAHARVGGPRLGLEEHGLEAKSCTKCLQNLKSICWPKSNIDRLRLSSAGWWASAEGRRCGAADGFGFWSGLSREVVGEGDIAIAVASLSESEQNKSAGEEGLLEGLGRKSD